MAGAEDMAVNMTNPRYHGAYTPVRKKVTKGGQIVNMFLDSDKCYEEDKVEERQHDWEVETGRSRGLGRL